MGYSEVIFNNYCTCYGRLNCKITYDRNRGQEFKDCNIEYSSKELKDFLKDKKNTFYFIPDKLHHF